MSRHCIYIAEGDIILQNRLREVLQDSGFIVRTFDSGYPIVTMMDNWPDVFLIDIELPGINGLEVCKWLKSHDESAAIPVIFISGDSYLKILAASAHADDYIEKPVAEAEMLRKINECLSTVELNH